ncbi:hypothetical protein RIF29_34374 [Crotalaria pallida]|uniref:Uncharacterized protein n=1 Tax=Crotalaria pallida TaxID=3830 RepID=A0AAN9E9D2_CROPI
MISNAACKGTAKETANNEPDEPRHIQMTNARCPRCAEAKVGLSDIIHAGHNHHRYQLECIACGNSWYASSGAVSVLASDSKMV